MNNPNPAHQLIQATRLAVVAGLCLAVAPELRAATDTWNGGAVPDGNWMTAGNWNGVTPATNDLLVFTGSTQTATTNNFPAGMPFNNISFSSGASAFSLYGNSMVLATPTDAGSGQIAGGNINNASANTSTLFLPITLANGKHTITGGGGSVYLNLNRTITQSNGAVAVMSGNINVTGGLRTNGSANGILGGWAIYSNNWATLDAHSNVVAYSAYTTVAAGNTIADNPAANVQIPVNGAAVSTTAGTTHINSLLFGSSTASTGTEVLNIGAGNTLVLGQNGGIFNNTGVAGGGTIRQLTVGASLAQGGTLTAGDGIHPATITLGSAALPSTASYMVINSVIADNGPAPVTLVLAGAYMAMNGQGGSESPGAVTNTYSGGTYILQGRCSQPGLFTFGYGPVHVLPGGQFNTGCQITNDVYLSGTGTVENNGMGAVRIYSAVLGSGVLGNLSGTVHLVGNAAIGANNNANNGGQPFNGVSGKITGAGGLMINSPTATANGGGTINIGSTNGVTIYTNDYNGDTTINGTAGGTVNSMLRICLPVDSNIMPHGITGSYAGGKTGNLILNATAASRQAIFELNGSTQTINGLSSTAASPVNNLIQDTTGGGLLIVGDSDATSTFGGIIQSSLPITKIGAGTLTLSGANTYNGDTTVKAGTLVTSTASTGGGNYSVSNNAALGVSLVSPGSTPTLNVNNLTFDTSGTALQLNTGTNGDPTAAMINVGGTLTMNGNVNLSLSGIGLTAGGPFTVLTYNPANRAGAGVFVLNNSPRVVATLHDDNAGHVTVTIVSADTAVKWQGGSSGNWDINDAANTLWQTVPSGNATYYIESGSGNDVALFDDSLTGTSNVNLTTTVTPQALTVSNSAANYLFTGPGRITGATGLTKYGSGSLTMANSGNNDFSGPIALNAGTLIISNNSSIANTLSGSGALVKSGNGSLVLSGDGSAYTGPVTINGGTLTVLNSASLATAASTTIASGATLDIGNNNVALGYEPISVSGTGVGGNGAIVNSSGYSGGALATSFQTVTLNGDTAIGGPGRLDFRSTDPNGGSDATLSTRGQAYNLTKVSGNTLQLASVQIDPALANINVQAGTLSIQGNMPLLGNANNAINVSGGATFQFLNLGNPVSKQLVLQNGAIINNNGGATTFYGPVTLQGSGLFNIASGTSLTFTNVISGPGSLSQITGPGTMTLAASNTYTGDTIIGAGTLSLSEPGSLAASHSLTIGAGATLDVSGRMDQTLTLSPGQNLTGAGTVNGNLTNATGNTVSIGSSSAIGTLQVNGNVLLSGTTVMKLNKSVSPSNDVLNATGSLNYGGTLVVTNLGSTLAPGDSFQLFNGGVTGNFTSVVLPSLPSGLTWNTNSLNSGLLSVNIPLLITNLAVSGTSLEIQGTGGGAGLPYVLLTSTNLALPVSQWTPLVTNSFDGNGNFDFTTNVDPTLSRQFYILSH